MFLQKHIELLRTMRQVSSFQKTQELHVRKVFYEDFAFREVDLALKKEYLWQNPYRVSRRFWNSHVYGETPLASLEIIGLKAQLNKTDCFVDLGSGRGRGAFFMHYRFGCKAVGVEGVPLFIEKALKIQKKLGVEGVEFLNANLSQLSPLRGSVFYLAWTCFEEALTIRLIQWLEQLPHPAKIITVSEPLASEQFSLLDQFNVPFPWGDGEIYLHEKKAAL